MPPQLSSEVDALASLMPGSSKHEGHLKSRWEGEHHDAWWTLPAELVVEVAFHHDDGGLLRHPARFVRWRPDREPAECGAQN